MKITRLIAAAGKVNANGHIYDDKALHSAITDLNYNASSGRMLAYLGFSSLASFGWSMTPPLWEIAGKLTEVVEDTPGLFYGTVELIGSERGILTATLLDGGVDLDLRLSGHIDLSERKMDHHVVSKLSVTHISIVLNS